MSQHDDFDRSLARWFEAEARPTATADVLDRALRATGRRRPRPGWSAALGSHWVGDGVGPAPGAAMLGRTGLRTSMALLLLLLVLVLVAGATMVGARLIQPGPVDLGIFEPISGRVVYGGLGGIWGVDPDGPDIKLTSGAGDPLGWSRDGTRLLVMRGHLFVLHADGSETQLTTDSLDPLHVRAATISPDGSRVVFATIDGAGDTGFLFSVNADGGPADVLLELDGLEGVSFSPDGTRIVYVAGRGDSGHRVSVMDADGTDIREILANDVTLGAGHVHGIAWSPTGDRIALGIEGAIYTFAPDGSGFTRALGSGRHDPFWSPDGSQLETRGPWHPGTLEDRPWFPPGSASPSTSPAPSPTPASSDDPGLFDPAAGQRSSDGTRRLVLRESPGRPTGSGAIWHLYVVHADGSETQVTERPMAIRGATISPDGSRVVFAGSSVGDPDGGCCTPWALYAVDADGGPAEMLLESRYGILDELAFSPDGTRIAYADGRGDWGHTVWLMDADGSDAHQILANETTGGAGHVTGLAWSPAGDRIALWLEGATYAFATDGSGFTRVTAGGG